MNMSISDVIKKHYFTTAQQDMRNLASPLKQYGITHFAKSSVYGDNHADILTTDVKASNIFYDMHCYKNLFNATIDDYSDSAFLWDDLASTDNSIKDSFKSIANDINIANGITVIKKNNNVVDFYHFATTRKIHHMNSFYLNNIDLLDSYILYFNDTAKNLLKASYENRIYLPNAGDKSIAISEHFKKHTASRIRSDNNLFHLARFYNISDRELECAMQIANGNRSKEIAIELNISIRTVEKHLLALRKKTGSKSLCQAIIKLLWK